MKFSGFVQPGDQLVLNAKIKSVDGSLTKLKVVGSVDDTPRTSGLVTIDSYNLADRGLGAQATDDYMKQKFRMTYRLLCDQLDPNGLLAYANSDDEVIAGP